MEKSSAPNFCQKIKNKITERRNRSASLSNMPQQCQCLGLMACFTECGHQVGRALYEEDCVEHSLQQRLCLAYKDKLVADVATSEHVYATACDPTLARPGTALDLWHQNARKGLHATAAVEVDGICMSCAHKRQLLGIRRSELRREPLETIREEPWEDEQSTNGESSYPYTEKMPTGGSVTPVEKHGHEGSRRIPVLKLGSTGPRFIIE